MVLAGRSVDDILCSLLGAYNEFLEDDTDDVVACLCKGMTLNEMGRYDEGFA